MVADSTLLPTEEPAKLAESVLHVKYPVSLLAQGEDPDDPYYAGDIYEQGRDDKVSKEARKWREETKDSPYLNLIRNSSKAYPELAHLASWMEVGSTVSRYKHLSRHSTERKERLHRVRVSQVDLKHGETPNSIEYTTNEQLVDALSKHVASERDLNARIFVVEDLSRGVIEAFGHHLKIDPYFFRMHLNDYMWRTNNGDAVDVKHLDKFTRKQPHFCLHYLRPRYYRDIGEFERATKQAAQFNVLRQIDSDRSRKTSSDANGAVVTMMRAKASVWIRPKSIPSECTLAVVLVDPTLKAEGIGESASVGYPIWGGLSAFEPWEVSQARRNAYARPSKSLYEDLIYWLCKLEKNDLDLMKAEPKTCTLPLLMLLASDWYHVVEYITAQLGRIEWEIELPSMRRDPKLDGTMQKLHPFRRNVALYRAMIDNAIDRIFSKQVQLEAEQGDADHGLPSMFRDYQLILQEIDIIQNRINNIVSVATALQSIEESRQAIDQNENVARITYLATGFIPPTFICGILSMVPNVTALHHTLWVFFAISIPVTVVAFSVLWCTQSKLGRSLMGKIRKTF